MSNTSTLLLSNTSPRKRARGIRLIKRGLQALLLTGKKDRIVETHQGVRMKDLMEKSLGMKTLHLVAILETLATSSIRLARTSETTE